MKVKVHPKRDQLVLRREKRSSLVLPGSNEAGHVLKVESVGPDAAYIGLEPGDRVMLGAGAGYGVDEDDDVVVVPASRVLAVIEELKAEDEPGLVSLCS